VNWGWSDESHARGRGGERWDVGKGRCAKLDVRPEVWEEDAVLICFISTDAAGV